jgi:membrane protease YdiL (CAAX protease family)
MTIESDAADSALLGTEPSTTRPARSEAANIFFRADGLRAGWRLLIFLLIFVGLGAALNFTVHHVPALEAWQKAQPKDTFTPTLLMLAEGLNCVMLIIPALIMTRIERKTFADYALPLSEAFGKRFWQGVPLGIGMLTLLMALIAALHGFSIQGLAITGTEAVKYGALYAIGFVMVGFFEEFSFRGYMQATLVSGIGFWPAALVLSFVFGAIHLGNSGEAILGAVMAGAFGLVAAFSLRRTGNIWFAIGMHASWDWGETYLYGVPDSGLLAKGHLLNASFHGPTWLTGGTMGPEGSVLAFIVLLIWALVIHLLFPAKQMQS